MIQKSIISFILLLVSTMVFSQEISKEIAVERFEEAEGDQTARIIYPKTDKNNKTCAIIKVETPLSLNDITFDAGMSGIEHSEQKNGEIWVYLSPGTQRITIQHAHLGVIRNYEFGTPLKEATVYIMKLRSGTVETIITDVINLQYLIVYCPIEGATIKIDQGVPETFIEGKFTKQLSYGKHTYTIEAPLYHPESGKIEISRSAKTELRPELKPAFGKLTINTQPEQGADVFIDGEKKGQTPCINNIPSGIHSVKVMKTWFMPTTETFTIMDGDNKTLNLTLQANFARITLNVDGEIYVDDQFKGSGSWSDRLISGAHKVEVKKAGHRSALKSIEVRPGSDQTIKLPAPTPIYGTLDINTNVEADIYLDGKQKDVTPAIIQQVLIGKHELELRAEDYKPYRQTIEIEEGKVLAIHPVMQESGNIFKKKKKPVIVDTKYFVAYRASLASHVGVSLGVCKSVGGYLHFSGGNEQFAYTAGAMYRLFPFLYGYTGYGAFTEKAPDGSYTTNAALETGFTFKLYRNITLSAGYSAAPFGKPFYGAPHIGIGGYF